MPNWVGGRNLFGCLCMAKYCVVFRPVANRLIYVRHESASLTLAPGRGMTSLLPVFYSL